MIAAIAAALILAALAVLQGAAATGAPVGRLLWGGQHTVLPTPLRIGSALSIILYAGMALVLLDRAGVIDIFGGDFSRVAAWVLFGYFVLGIFLNSVSRSRAERYVMTPTVIVLAVLANLVATGP